MTRRKKALIKNPDYALRNFDNALRDEGMTVPKRINRGQLQKDPYLIWNSFVELLAESEYHELTERQRAAHLVFWYMSEVENGGHLQYFENRGTKRVGETIDALTRLGASCHARILQRAIKEYNARPRKRIRTIDEYVETALQEECDTFDQEYGECQPPLEEVLKTYLDRNQAEFVAVE